MRQRQRVFAAMPEMENEVTKRANTTSEKRHACRNQADVCKVNVATGYANNREYATPHKDGHVPLYIAHETHRVTYITWLQ